MQLEANITAVSVAEAPDVVAGTGCVCPLTKLHHHAVDDYGNLITVFGELAVVVDNYGDVIADYCKQVQPFDSDRPA